MLVEESITLSIVVLEFSNIPTSGTCLSVRNELKGGGNVEPHSVPNSSHAPLESALIKIFFSLILFRCSNLQRAH